MHNTQSIDQLTQKVGGVPPIDWHVNNITQLQNNLRAIAAADQWLVDEQINKIDVLYQVFLNSYEKADRKLALVALHDASIALAEHVKSINFEHYTNQAVHKWGMLQNTFKPEGRGPLPLDKYVSTSLSCFVGFHDFALGLAKACEVANAEPEKALYDKLA